MKSEAVILCEGYYDRAFWDGWLRFLGCVEERTDPWDKPVRGSGQHGYRTPDQGFVRITPCAGKNNILPWARNRLQGRQIEPLTTLVVCVDRDDAEPHGPAEDAVTEAAVEGLIKRVATEYTSPNPGEYRIDEGATRIVYMPWWANDPPRAEIPDQQTLERLVCAALAAVYPARAEAVATWLAARPDRPSKPDPKEHAWSYLAGWSADHGCEAFFKCLWDAPEVAGELRRRLREIGAWQVVESMVGGVKGL